jgi:hypothetical protein
MKVIIYNNLEGGVTVCTPSIGARLAHGITLSDGTQVLSDHGPTEVDKFLRRWPVQGITAMWAESEEAFLARIRQKDIPHGATEVTIVEAETLPIKDELRNAWRCVKGTIIFDLEKSKELTKQRLRVVREEKLKALDSQFLQALETGAPTNSIVSQKQILRDVTARVDKATTVEELRIIQV